MQLCIVYRCDVTLHLLRSKVSKVIYSSSPANLAASIHFYQSTGLVDKTSRWATREAEPPFIQMGPT